MQSESSSQTVIFVLVGICVLLIINSLSKPSMPHEMCLDLYDRTFTETKTRHATVEEKVETNISVGGSTSSHTGAINAKAVTRRKSSSPTQSW